MNWIKVFDQEILLHNDFVTSVKVTGKKLCIVKSGENFFAAQSKCPHAGADLSRGWCKKEKLICPYHRYEYDLHSGRGAKGQGDYIRIYPTEIRNDGVYIGFNEKRGLLRKIFDIWTFNK